MHVRFPWVGDEPPRAARLRLGGQVVAIGGDGAEQTWRMTGPDTAELRTVPSESYPFALRLDARWGLDDEGLRLTLAVRNEARTHAPFGVGVRVALAPIAKRVELLVPAEDVWPAVGDGPPIAVSGDTDFRRPAAIVRPITARFTRRHFANLQTQLAVLSRGREVWLTTSADFREAVVAVQPDGSGVLESATCVPDAFARQAAGMQTGLRVLAPGEAWRGHALLVAR
jgi:galactose mutarotase-like enzyme